MASMLGGLAFAVFRLARIAFGPGPWWRCVALGTLSLSCTSYAQDLNDVTHRFLQRHGVPCLSVVNVGSPRDIGEVATCQDGREWALFWLEDEIAFVHPQTGEPYKWDRQLYLSHPGLYAGPAPRSQHQVLVSDRP